MACHRFCSFYVVVATAICASLMGVSTLLIWTAGYYVQTQNVKNYNPVPTRCYVTQSWISPQLCSIRECTSYMSGASQTCNINTYACWDGSVDIQMRATMLPQNVSSLFGFALDGGFFLSVADAQNWIYSLNGSSCWYQWTSPPTDVLWARPDPEPAYIAGIVFALLTGASAFAFFFSLILHMTIGSPCRCCRLQRRPPGHPAPRTSQTRIYSPNITYIVTPPQEDPPTQGGGDRVASKTDSEQWVAQA